jgi:hypothetical protein
VHDDPRRLREALFSMAAAVRPLDAVAFVVLGPIDVAVSFRGIGGSSSNVGPTVRLMGASE